MIAVVDYGAGNITSVRNALASLGQKAEITADPEQIRKASSVIFPGVGAAGSAMDNLHRTGLDLAIRDSVRSGKPVLGICVGLQVLYDLSEEDGGVPCLGFLKGRVVRFQSEPGLKIPHMGWNQVDYRRSHPIFDGIPSGTEFYFVHSYHPAPADAATVLCETTYGSQTFACAAMQGNLVGVQFHPEKSGDAGLRLLRNFCQWNGGVSC